MMKRTMLAALAVAVTGLLGAAPADAQDFPDYKFDLGINGGFTSFTSALDDDHLGEGSDDVRFESGWLTGAQATFWFTPRFGLRANGTYTERPLNQGGMFTIGSDNNLAEDINLWTFSGDLMFRFGGAPGMMSGPFLALGLGGAISNPAGDQALTTGTAEDDALTGRFFTTSDGNRFAVVEETQLMGLVGIGTDLRMSDNFAVRLELGDRIWDAPLRDEAALAADPEEDIGNVMHQLYGQVGAHVLLGLDRPEVVAVAPAPPPPPAPEPEPEPEPVEEAIRICVVDPGAEDGIRVVDAIYLPETRDTMVVVNGTRRAFRTTVPDVTIANEADWFVRGEPLTVRLADDATIEWTTWQSARMIDADRLTFLGTSRGLPVYANTDEIRDLRTDWMGARRAAMSNDLEAILEEDAELAAELEEVQYLYVPLRPTGCVFQTVRVVEQVRKK